ncbi:MAG: tyrosine-type recombinase/integrase [Candidatus Magasanikbacteria bacterium]|nr:tyrosine-type recombinase/integrase [Candidatus Magasanikbacteria bacterium]
MATIRNLKSGWTVDIRFEGKRQRLKSPEDSPAGARAYLKFLQKKLARGEPIRPLPEVGSQTFAEFVPIWFKNYVIPNNKPSEHRGKRSMLNRNLLPVFGKTPLNKISAYSIEEYKATYLKHGLSPKTINNHLTVLRKCLRTACDWEKLENVPKIKLLRYPPTDQEFLSIEEGVKLANAAKEEPEWYAIILVALRTGMRLGELFGLKWQDIDFDQSVIRISRSIVEGIESSPKTHRERKVPFPESVKVALQAIGPKEGLIFHRSDGRPLSHGIAEYALHRMCDKAGLRHIGWHALRRACASALARVRGNSLEAQRMLGHTSITMTKRYTYTLPSTLHDAVAALDIAANNIESGHQMGTTEE